MGLIDKYPYTNFAGINLDYYIQHVNHVGDDVKELQDQVDTLPDYVKNISVVNNAALKVVKGSGYTDVLAIPTGSHFVLEIIKDDPDDADIKDMNVADQVKYDCNVTDYNIISEMYFSGIPTVIRLMKDDGLGNTFVFGIYMMDTAYDNTSMTPIIKYYDITNSVWKIFKVEWDTTPYIYLTRLA